jgi:heme exporter protein D
MSFADFIAMGGYARYVWPAFGITAVVLLLNLWTARRAHAEARRASLRRLDMEEPRS